MIDRLGPAVYRSVGPRTTVGDDVGIHSRELPLCGESLATDGGVARIRRVVDPGDGVDLGTRSGAGGPNRLPPGSLLRALPAETEIEVTTDGRYVRYEGTVAVRILIGSDR